jgi:DNA repair exonuclease SbcCD ATPase subunit
MARLTEEDKARNEAAIRAAMERILSGNLPAGGKTDLKTLAAVAGVTRTGFYPKRNRDGTPRPGAHQHLAEEFERRVRELQQAGKIVDPRKAQIEWLQAERAELKNRIADRDARLEEATAFKKLAISRLAAQHEEIERLRRQITDGANVRSLSAAADRTAPYGSFS